MIYERTACRAAAEARPFRARSPAADPMFSAGSDTDAVLDTARGKMSPKHTRNAATSEFSSQKNSSNWPVQHLSWSRVSMMRYFDMRFVVFHGMNSSSCFHIYRTCCVCRISLFAAIHARRPCLATVRCETTPINTPLVIRTRPFPPIPGGAVWCCAGRQLVPTAICRDAAINSYYRVRWSIDRCVVCGRRTKQRPLMGCS